MTDPFSVYGSAFSDRKYVDQLLRQMRLNSTIKVDFPLVESAIALNSIRDTHKAITALASKFGCSWILDGKKVMFRRIEIKEDQ